MQYELPFSIPKMLRFILCLSQSDRERKWEFHPWHFWLVRINLKTEKESKQLQDETTTTKQAREKYDRVKITILLFIAVGHFTPSDRHIHRGLYSCCIHTMVWYLFEQIPFVSSYFSRFFHSNEKKNNTSFHSKGASSASPLILAQWLVFNTKLLEKILLLTKKNTHTLMGNVKTFPHSQFVGWSESRTQCHFFSRNAPVNIILSKFLSFIFLFEIVFKRRTQRAENVIGATERLKHQPTTNDAKLEMNFMWMCNGNGKTCADLHLNFLAQAFVRRCLVRANKVSCPEECR